jgi:hypothetical protein
MEVLAGRSRLARRAWRPAVVAPVGHPRTTGDGRRSLGRSSWTPQPGYRAWASSDPPTMEIATASVRKMKKIKKSYISFMLSR